MTRSEPEFLVVGQLSKVHGTSGELLVWTLTDHPESTFAPGVILYLGDDAGRVLRNSHVQVEVVEARAYRKGFLVRLKGIQTRSQAEELRGRFLLRPREEVADLQEGEVFYHQLLGMEVVTVEGERVGRVVEVYEIQPADLLAVRGPGGLRHIPLVRSLVRELDVEAGRIVIDPPDGLLEL